MKKYEAVFILDIRKADDEGAAFSREYADLVTSLGGTVQSTTLMGRRQFTYEIDKHRAGLYIDFIFEVDEKQIAAIKDKFRLDARVLRNMILICDRPENAPEGVLKLNLE